MLGTTPLSDLPLSSLPSAAGGTTQTGAASLSLDFSVSAVGSVTRPGSASLSVSLSCSATGSATWSGSSGPSVDLSCSPVGAVSLAGASSCSVDLSCSASGSLLLPGAAACSVDLACSAVGGLVKSGAADCGLSWSCSASSAVSLAGASSCSVDLACSATGGYLQSGSAALSLSWSCSAPTITRMRLGSAYLSVGFRVDATGEVLGEGGAGEGGTWRVIPRSKDVVKPELKTFRVLPRSSTFVVRLDNDVLIYLEKYSLDSRIYLFDFSLMPEIQDAGDYLTGIVALSSLPVEDPASLVVGSPTINMEKTGVKVRITGGVANQTYTITCRVSTHDGATLEGRGELFILTA